LRGISKAFGRFRPTRGSTFRCRGHDPRHHRRKRRRQVDADVDPLRLLPGRFGEILIGGKPIAITDSQTAIRAGIGMVHQHFMLVENFTVLENIILGAEDGPMLRPIPSARASELKRLAGIRIEVDPDARSRNCRSATSSGSRSSRRCIAAPTS
jgi:hypothetical protein